MVNFSGIREPRTENNAQKLGSKRTRFVILVYYCIPCTTAKDAAKNVIYFHLSNGLERGLEVVEFERFIPQTAGRAAENKRFRLLGFLFYLHGTVLRAGILSFEKNQKTTNFEKKERFPLYKCNDRGVQRVHSATKENKRDLGKSFFFNFPFRKIFQRWKILNSRSSFGHRTSNSTISDEGLLIGLLLVYV